MNEEIHPRAKTGDQNDEPLALILWMQLARSQGCWYKRLAYPVLEA